MVGRPVGVGVDAVVASFADVVGVADAVVVGVVQRTSGAHVAVVGRPVGVGVDAVVAAFALVAEVGDGVAVRVRSVIASGAIIGRVADRVAVGVVQRVNGAEVAVVGRSVTVGVDAVVAIGADVVGVAAAIAVRVVLGVVGARVASVGHAIRVAIERVVAIRADVVGVADAVGVAVGAGVGRRSVRIRLCRVVGLGSRRGAAEQAGEQQDRDFVIHGRRPGNPLRYLLWVVMYSQLGRPTDWGAHAVRGQHRLFGWTAGRSTIS